VGLPEDATEELVRDLLSSTPSHLIVDIEMGKSEGARLKRPEPGDTGEEHAIVTFLDHAAAASALEAIELFMPKGIGVSAADRYDWDLRTLALFDCPKWVRPGTIQDFFQTALRGPVHVEYVIRHSFRYVHFWSVEAAEAAMKLTLPPACFGKFATLQASIAHRQLVEILRDVKQPPPGSTNADAPTDASGGAKAAGNNANPTPQKCDLRLDLKGLPDPFACWAAAAAPAQRAAKRARGPPPKAAGAADPTCDFQPPKAPGGPGTAHFRCARRLPLDRLAGVRDIVWTLEDGRWVGRGAVVWAVRPIPDFMRVHAALCAPRTKSEALEAAASESGSDGEDDIAARSDSAFSDAD